MEGGRGEGEAVSRPSRLLATSSPQACLIFISSPNKKNNRKGCFITAAQSPQACHSQGHCCPRKCQASCWGRAGTEPFLREVSAPSWIKETRSLLFSQGPQCCLAQSIFRHQAGARALGPDSRWERRRAREGRTGCRAYGCTRFGGKRNGTGLAESLHWERQ